MIIATSILGFSITGIVALVGVKMWELRSRHTLLSGLRMRLSLRAQWIVAFIKGDAPHSLKRTARMLRRVIRAYTSYLFAGALVFFERILEQGLHKVREAPGSDTRGEASPFLREVAAYKRMLGKEKEIEEDR